MKKHFDCVLINPPYSGSNTGDNLYVDFINKCIIVSDIVCTVNPDVVLLGHNSGGWANKNKINELRQNIDNYHPYIEQIDSSAFDAGIKSSVSICLFNKKNIPNKICVKFNGGYTINVDKQEEIINISSKYLLEFWDKLQKYIKKSNDSVFEHMFMTPGFGDTIKKYQEKRVKDINNIDKNKLYVFLYKPNASFSGIIYKSINKDNIAVKYNEDNFSKSCGVISFNHNEYNDSKNFCKYMTSYFVSLIIKLSGNVFHFYDKYIYIPWLDFSKSYTDEELFKMIGMKYDKEEINKVLNEK